MGFAQEKCWFHGDFMGTVAGFHSVGGIAVKHVALRIPLLWAIIGHYLVYWEVYHDIFYHIGGKPLNQLALHYYYDGKRRDVPEMILYG